MINATEIPDHIEHGHNKSFDMLVVIVFLLSVCLITAGYHKLIRVAYYIPESTMLITMGVMFGYALNIFDRKVSQRMTLTPDMFFYYFLPPIVLDASYTLHERAFAETLLPVLAYAIFGTFANFLIVGYSLHYLALATGLTIPGFQLHTVLLFSSIISAVDPVAVLAIFKEIGVNRKLYFLVFGESLLNDGVTIVLYEALLNFNSSPALDVTAFLYGTILFIVVSVGGVFIGVMIGFLCCLTTRIFNSSLLLEPVVVIGFAFLAYTLAFIFRCSGIFALVVCGLMQAMYAFENISDDSRVFTRRFLHTASTISEAIIFLLLGIAVLSMETSFRNLFYAASVIFICVVTRFIVIFSMTFILNRTDCLVEEISYTDQFILAYGGLRGAVAFALVKLAESFRLDNEPMFTLTMFFILFTVIPLGLTLKPLVKLFNVSTDSENELFFNEIAVTISGYYMAGIESILDRLGMDIIFERFQQINDHYIRPVLQRDPYSHKTQLMKLFDDMNVKTPTQYQANIDTNVTLFDTDQVTRIGSIGSGSIGPSNLHSREAKRSSEAFWGRDRFENARHSVLAIAMHQAHTSKRRSSRYERQYSQPEEPTDKGKDTYSDFSRTSLKKI